MQLRNRERHVGLIDEFGVFLYTVLSIYTQLGLQLLGDEWAARVQNGQGQPPIGVKEHQRNGNHKRSRICCGGAERLEL